MGDAVLLNQSQALLGVEALHHDDRPSHPVDGHRPHERCGVVQRRGAQIHIALRETHDALEHWDEGGVGPEGFAAQWPPHALRMARGTRGVEHRKALLLMGEWLGGVAADELVVVDVSVRTASSAVDHQAQLDRGGERDHLGRQLAQLR